MKEEILSTKNINENIKYNRYIAKKKIIIVMLCFMIIIFSIIAVNLGSTDMNFYQMFKTILGKGTKVSDVVVWKIRLPRICSAIIAGAGLSVAGCVMQNNLRNPLASPATLGISNAAAFGANIAIIVFGAGSAQNIGLSTVIIDNPYLVTLSAFIWSIIGTIIILLLAKFRDFSPEAMILAGVALSSLFSAGTILIQYFADDIQIAAAVFWTFGDIGRATWKEVLIMLIVVVLSIVYFIVKQWDYNSLSSGEETAKSLGVNVETTRLISMFLSSIITAVIVSFLGIIGFVGLVAPQIMRRIIGGDHRYLIPASIFSGSLLLLISDTIARSIVSPVVLPVGAITSFFGAPLFIYILSRRYQRR